MENNFKMLLVKSLLFISILHFKIEPFFRMICLVAKINFKILKFASFKIIMALQRVFKCNVFSVQHVTYNNTVSLYGIQLLLKKKDNHHLTIHTLKSGIQIYGLYSGMKQINSFHAVALHSIGNRAPTLVNVTIRFNCISCHTISRII